MMKLIRLTIIILFFSCSQRDSIKTDQFFNKIEVGSWNINTFDFMSSSICDSLINEETLKSSNYVHFVSKEGDSIKSLDKHLKFYFNKRLELISYLKENKSLFSKYTDTLVVTEKHIEAYNSKASFIVTNNRMKNSILFIFDSEGKKKVEKLHKTGYIYEYDSIISSKPKCSIRNINLLNNVDLETVFYFNENKKIVSELKFCYINFHKIN